MLFAPKIDRIADISDLKKVAKHRVPSLFFNYVDEGSYTESSYRRNYDAYQGILFRQQVGRDVRRSLRSTRTTLCGFEASMPLAIAPVGGLGVQRADGEIMVARAAEKAGVPFTLSTMSICSIEEVRKHTSAPFWFQLYVSTDDEFNNNLIDRAKKAGCTALVVTLDLQVYCQRHKDVRNGIIPTPKKNLKNALDFAMHLPWCIRMAKTKNKSFGNILGHVKGVTDLSTMHKFTSNCADESLTFAKLRQFKERFGGPLIVKGIMEPNDALAAVAAGADAIVISNHGGRQLDGTPAPIEMLPAVVEAVGDLCEVYLDGGIYTGQNILRALALGAKGVFAGRAIAYGLGAYGEEGVSKALDILNRELQATMALCGRNTLEEIDISVLQPNTYPTPDLFKLKDSDGKATKAHQDNEDAPDLLSIDYVADK